MTQKKFKTLTPNQQSLLYLKKKIKKRKHLDPSGEVLLGFVSILSIYFLLLPKAILIPIVHTNHLSGLSPSSLFKLFDNEKVRQDISAGKTESLRDQFQEIDIRNKK